MLTRNRKGIILAGGSGTRLHPLTISVSKQLLPVYDKPMIYYPLTTLIEAGINEILIISTPQDRNSFENLLGNGSQFGVRIEYAVQEKPNGLAQAFVIGEEFIGKSKVALILGDNIFHASNIDRLLMEANMSDKNTIFAYRVNDPQRYGVVEFDEYDNAVSIEEKPLNPKSNYAVPGLYFYNNDVIEVAKTIKPSARGEYEISDINAYYLDKNQLSVKAFDRSGTTWLDTGTIQSLAEASLFVEVMQNRTGNLIGSPEEAAFRHDEISKDSLIESAKKYDKSGYGEYLLKLVQK
ncbi:gp187 [Sphingomonas phage PAU]|uniref:gp187 n=1 Tax=Sphingomonas phage PAU TaxID=1150991 RepID=UPI0002573359|nr:gp187 [Sphingomonas phage PAU]AFF28185.1 gp187 [Sphingomonas phage PAU]